MSLSKTEFIAKRLRLKFTPDTPRHFDLYQLRLIPDSGVRLSSRS